MKESNAVRQSMPETLTGLIERVTYHNPENGFAVLKVQVKGRQDLVTVIGSTTSVSAGEHLEATGKWVVDREHGQQFKADELKTTHPASAEGIEKYLASGAIRSIGPKICRQDRRHLQGTDPRNLRDGPRFPPPHQGHRPRTGQADQPKLEGAEGSPQDHALPGRAWHQLRPGRANLPDLRPGIHRQDQGEPLPTGRRHPGHRFQDRRRTRRQDGDRPQ